MKAMLHAVYWEILWKNRLVFPVLAGMLGLGAALAWAAGQAPPEAEWIGRVRSVTILTFLISIFISFTPFTLMESSGGWRMNSMITRWFTLPMRTVQMVFLPLLVAGAFISLLVLAWMPVLNHIAPGLDAFYFISVLVAGQVAINALAWTVPRKPVQFWVGMGLLFPVLLILTLGMQDQPHQEQMRRGLLVPVGGVSLLLAAFTWYAAGRNRCGAWPGEVPLDWLWGFLRHGRAHQPGRSAFRSLRTALFSLEVLPPLRLLGLSWVGLCAAIFLYVSLTLRDQDSHIAHLAFSLRLLPLLSVSMLPILGVLWMAVWGLFAGGEPSVAFRTRLNSFRGTLPVSCGQWAGQRIATLILGWGLVWLPLLGLSFFHTSELTGIPVEDPAGMQAKLASFAALSAYVAVGALPLFLWGRFEGFPNFLLAGIGTWAWIWLLGDLLFLEPGMEPGWRWLMLGGLLFGKVALTTWGLMRAWRGGHITWKFPVALVGGWLLVTGGLVFGLPLWRLEGVWPALIVVLVMPLGRLAWCPVALAANRHR